MPPGYAYIIYLNIVGTDISIILYIIYTTVYSLFGSL